MARRKKADATPLTQERLREVFRYDPDTGYFWRFKPAGRANIDKPAGDRHDHGYVLVSIDSVRYFAHRLAWFYVYGTWPVAQMDHINGIRDDNRIVNLREATNTENCRHGGLPVHNTSGFKGVTRWKSRPQNWIASIKINGKRLYLGTFSTPEAAHQAYCDAAQQHHGAFWEPGHRLSHRRFTRTKLG